MQYTQLPNSYKYETIADAIYAREVEYFHYAFDKTNFEYLLKTQPDGVFKENIQQRLADTSAQMTNVLAVIDALKNQIDDQDAYALAVEVVTQRRKEKENK